MIMMKRGGDDQETAVEALQHDQQDLEYINNVWVTFRLPIPIPDKSRQNSCRTAEDDWLLQVVDQLRLLQTMKEQFTTHPNGVSSRSSSSKHQRMKQQLNLAYSGQASIEQTNPYSPPMTNVGTSKIDNDACLSLLYENSHRLMRSMREDTEDICNKFHEWLSRYPEQQMQENVIDKIFFSPLEPVSQDELLDEFSDDRDGDGHDFHNDEVTAYTDTSAQKRSQSTSSRKRIPTKQQNQESKEIDPIEFQKKQQELLEEELSSMATRLKSSTLAMNATLQTQTKDLESMEDIAQSNLDNVSSTTKKVEQRLTEKKGWKKRLATWSMIGTVVGMWILCFMIMRTVPKRKMGQVHYFGLNTCKRFLIEKSGLLKVRLKVLLHGGSIDSDWDQPKANYEKERIGHEQQRQHHQQRQECELLPDGAQVCRDGESYDKSDAKAQQLSAERKQRRIDENMANARTVDAMECIPPTPAMHNLHASLEGMENIRKHLTDSFHSSPEGSEKRQSFMNNLETLYFDFMRFSTAFETETKKARSEYWDGKEQQAVQDMPFCKEDTDNATSEQIRLAWTALMELINDEKDRLQREAEEAKKAEMEAQEKEAKLRKEADDARLQREAASKRKDEEVADAAKKAAEEAAAANGRKRATEEAEATKRVEEEAAAVANEVEEVAVSEFSGMISEDEAEATAAEAEAATKAEEEVNAEEAKAAEDKSLREKVEIETRKARETAKQIDRPGFMASDLRNAARRGQNDLLAYYISEMPIWIDAPDASGWRPLHEAARAGNLVGIELLISAGCDPSSRTGRNGNGGTALWWAIKQYGENHDAVSLLRFHNALEVGPDEAIYSYKK